MTVKRTLILGLGVFLVLSVLVLWLSMYWSVGRHLTVVEDQEMRNDLERLHEALDDVFLSQERIALDYAHWEDSWNFVRSPYPSYIETNLQWDAQVNLGVDHFFFLDTAGHLVAHVGADLHADSSRFQPPPKGLLELMAEPVSHFAASEADAFRWIASTDSVALLMCVVAITRGESDAEIGGFLVLARSLDSAQTLSLARRVRLPVDIRLSGVGNARALPNSDVKVDRHERVPFSVGLLRFGDSVQVDFVLRRERLMERNGWRNLYLQIGLQVASLLVLLAGLVLLLQFRLLRPLRLLEGALFRISRTGDVSLRAPLVGPTEIRLHAQAINGMLDRIAEGEKAQQVLADHLRETQGFTAHLVNYLPGATFACDAQGYITAWNRAMESFTNTRAEEWLGRSVRAVAPLLYDQERPLLLQVFLDEKLGDDWFKGKIQRDDGSWSCEEFVTCSADGSGRFLEQIAAAIRDGQGVLLGAIQTLRDVTGQRRAEQRMEFLSLHDALTGLFNRTYFNEVSSSFLREQNDPVAVVMIDIDGLKLVNDTLGHEHGDALILAAASLLRKAFPDDPVARIGGDEFVVLLARSDAHKSELAVLNLQEEIEQYNSSEPPLPVHMSVGHAVGCSSDGLGPLVKAADASLYRHKDSMRDVVRRDYLTYLQRRFAEIHSDARDPVDKILEVASEFAVFLNVEVNEQERLALLVRYRDIGRVGTSGRLFMKAADLDKDEMDEVRKIPEIGYRIAKISRELEPVADLILKQREWWNGQGYPLGIAGEQIPFLNRLLAVAEAFTLMTTPRFRRRTLGKEEALEELRMLSGQKFDPTLVEFFERFIS